jgi:DNA-binding response OmpR family regulator
MKILVVEDQDAIRRMIEALVSARGHRVSSASNGAKALEAALASPPDAVLLDINLPGSLDGIEICRRLRADAATSGIPIVMISAMDDSETRRTATEAGATAYFSKPFSPMALLKEIDGIEARRR